MSRRSSSQLKVLMNGLSVGVLAKSSKGVLSFFYEESWLTNEKSRAISLSLPLTSQVYSGHLVENYFDNLLPDSQPIRNRLQARVGAESTRAFDLLRHIGRDCVGALQLLPENEEVEVRRVSAKPIDEGTIEELLIGHRAAPLGVDIGQDFRISIAGAQEKTALLLRGKAWYKPYGATPTSHIFKLPIGELGTSGINLNESVENEYLCQKLLSAFGLPVATTEITEFGNQKVLVVERFDRKWAQDGSWLMRLPQEDMCQATGTSGSQKYESEGGPGMRTVMDVLLGSAEAHNDRKMFLTAQLLFWMLGAIDGHAKNFSLFHLRGGLFRMSPLYDVISIYPVIANGQLSNRQATMAMAALGKNKHYHWDSIVRRHWLSTARKCRFPEKEMEEIITQSCDMITTCVEEVGDNLPPGFPTHISDAIFSLLLKARDRLI